MGSSTHSTAVEIEVSVWFDAMVLQSTFVLATASEELPRRSRMGQKQIPVA